MKSMQYKGDTFNGEAIIQIVTSEDGFMIFIEQSELEEDRDEKHLFGYSATTKEEAQDIYDKITSKDFIDEVEIEDIGFQYY